MTTEIAERKQRIAERVETDDIATVQLDIARMKELGVLVDVDLHGFSMFTRRATWSELGIDGKSVRRKRLKRGSKDMLPKAYMSTLHSLSTRFRQSLDRPSFVLEGFKPWRWVPFTAYEAWQDEWAELQNELDALKTEIVERWDEFAEDVADDFSLIADEAWRAIKNGRPDDAGDFALVTRGGTFGSRDEFKAHVVNRALAQLPTPEQIESGLYATYRNAMVATGADVESEWARETKLAAQREIAWQEARTAEEEERAKRRQIKIEVADAEHQAEVQRRERERRMRLMRQAELEHAKEQLAETVNPFQEVVEQFRAQIYSDVKEIADSIASNGYVHGKVAKRAKGLLDTYRILGAATGDAELEDALVALRGQLQKRTVDGKQTYDVAAVEGALKDVATLTHEAAVEVAKRVGAHTRAGSLEL